MNETLVVSNVTLTRCCWKVFSGQPVTFKRNWSTDFIFDIWWFNTLTMIFHSLFFIFRHSKLVGCAFILIIYWVCGLLAPSNPKVDTWQPSCVLKWIPIFWNLAKNPQGIMISQPVWKTRIPTQHIKHKISKIT